MKKYQVANLRGPDKDQKLSTGFGTREENWGPRQEQFQGNMRTEAK